MTALCPHCGYDLARDEVIEFGDVSFDPRGAVKWRGDDVALSGSERSILQTILKAGGRPVSWTSIAERMGYEGDDPRSIIATFVCRMRGKMPGVPIRNVWGVGWKWVV